MIENKNNGSTRFLMIFYQAIKYFDEDAIFAYVDMK